MFVIVVEAFANGTPCPLAGQYVKSFDFEADNGIGFLETTFNLDEALTFTDFGEAFMFWKQSPKCKPFREDGKPNRPLTCTTVSILTQDAARKMFSPSKNNIN